MVLTEFNGKNSLKENRICVIPFSSFAMDHICLLRLMSFIVAKIKNWGHMDIDFFL